MPVSSQGPPAMMVRPLMDTPRSITATSSKVLALKLIPASQFLPGDHTVRINAPSMIASTSASTQARFQVLQRGRGDRDRDAERGSRDEQSCSLAKHGGPRGD
jgi:hypothetical protein